MIKIMPLQLLSGATVIGTEVKLPKTTLLTISTDKGYIMCGALDVGLLNEKLSDRNIIAARAVGVRTLDDLLHAPLESITYAAEALGITIGMRGKDALEKML